MGLKLKRRKLQHITLTLEQNKESKYHFDIVVFVFLLNQESKCSSKNSVIFYGNTSTENGSVQMTADSTNTTIDLSQLPSDISEIAIAVSIYDAEYYNQSFADVEDGTVTVTDNINDKTLSTCTLSTLRSKHTYIMGSFDNNMDSWQWKESAEQNNKFLSIKDLCRQYSLQSSDN